MSEGEAISPEEFAQATDTALGALPGSWTLEPQASSPYARRYRNPKGIRVGVTYDAHRSHELDVSLRRQGRDADELALTEVLRATTCPPEEVLRAEYLAPDAPAALHESLQTVIELLGTWAPGFLAGKRRAYWRAKKLLERDSVGYTEQFERDSI